MKKTKNTIIASLAVLLLLMSALMFPFVRTICAPSCSAGFSIAGITLNIGDNYTVDWAINASEKARMQVDFGCSSGISITSVTCDQTTQVSTSSVVDWSGNYSSFNGKLTIHANAAGDFTVRMTKITLVSEYSSSEVTTITETNRLPAFTIHVRTEEEKQASIAEQERIRREQEAEASRRQSEEAERAASISASASEEERRRRESEDASYREWLSRSAEEAAEASRQASISASESEVQASISASESEVAASISASESEVERTRPTEIGSRGYVRYTYGPDLDEDGEGDEVFYFVTEGSDVMWPEGAESISMRLRDVNVLALRMDGMASNTYLVYGMHEENDVPAWEYWHRSTNEFFRFDYLNADTSYKAPTTEAPTTEAPAGSDEADTSTTASKATTTAAPSTGTTLPSNSGRKASVQDVLLLVLSGAVGGAALTALIFLLVLRGRKKDEAPLEEASTVPETPAEPASDGPQEKTGDTDAVDLE